MPGNPLLGLGLPMGQPPAMTPMNDIQVVAILGAVLLHQQAVADPRTAVDLAIDLVAESILAAEEGRMMQRVRSLQALRKATDVRP